MRSRVALLLLLAACAPHHARPAMPGRFTRPALNRVIVPLRSAPGGETVESTICGLPLTLLERRGASTRVEVRGRPFFVDDVDLTAAITAYHHCQTPIVTGNASAELLPAALRAIDAWETFDDELPTHVFQRDRDRCLELRVRDGRLVGDTIEWGYERTDLREIRLTGPTIRGGDSFLCEQYLFVAHHDRERIDLVPLEVDLPAAAIVAYAPVAATTWFTTRAACERQAPEVLTCTR